LAGSPEVLTVVLNDTAGTPTTTRAATLFVVPLQQVRDSVLVEAHRVGRSAEAFAALARRYEPAVTRTVQRIVGNHTDAQDVSQFVFMELARTRARFPGTLSGWLRVVSRNAALAFLRAKRRRRKHEQGAAKGERVEAAPVVADESLAVALDQLPPELGQAVRLRYLDGYTQQEAAAIVGVPRGTLSRRAAAGVQILRELLEWDADCSEQPGGGWRSEG
jgi:RNA polymerase sigma factor (sigma-70 family)